MCKFKYINIDKFLTVRQKGNLIMKASEKEQLKKVMESLKSGELANQPCWSFIRDLNSFSEERLDSIAIQDGYRQYSYRQMFRYWERYAEAFSGANISGKKRSRVALITTPMTETIFSFYGLNMTGASVSLIYPFDLFDDKQIQSMIEREGITDLVVSELYAFPKLMKRLLRDREVLGLRSVIVLGSPMGGEYGVPALEFVRNTNRELFRELPDAILMEDLLKEYEAYPISYGKNKSSEGSVILHTTGTVSGMHKPIPMSDMAVNSCVKWVMEAKETYEDFKKAPKQMISCLTLNTSWVYAMADMMHVPLGLGMELVCLPVGGSNPNYADAIEHYGVNILFSSKSILDSWLKSMPEMDLSKLKIMFMGGTYISPEYRQKFNDYLRSCGSSARVINGYGLSELGGACMLSPTTRDDDAIGFLLPGFKAKIFVEDEECFYDISEGPRTGVLFLSSPTMSSGRLGNTVFFELDRIDDEDYFNTNDLVRVNEDGSMTCIGRSNQFFVNNEGVRFDAGLVQTAISSQPGIEACGVVPELHKTLHDNIPVLYVQTGASGPAALTILRKALIQVFINDDVLADTNMPGQCVLTESIPLNSSGKVDTKKIASGSVTGKRFSVKPVKMNGKMQDILLLPAAEGELATMGAGIPEELEGDPYNILSELFAAIPDIQKGEISKIFRIPGLRELVKKLTGFDIKNIPESMRTMTPKMLNLALRKYISPIMKGDKKMGKKKKALNGFMPKFKGGAFPMPPVPFVPFPNMLGKIGAQNGSGENDDAQKEKREKRENIKSMLKTFWMQNIDMQKSAVESSKEQWNQFFDYMMEIQETLFSSIPDDSSSLPFAQLFVMPPKAFMKWARNFQEMANDHFVEQADSLADFFIQGQQQFYDMVDSATGSEAAEEEDQDVVDEEND